MPGLIRQFLSFAQLTVSQSPIAILVSEKNRSQNSLHLKEALFKHQRARENALSD